MTKASPICSRRIVDIGTIDDEVPLSGVCNFLRFLKPKKRYAQCDSVAPDVQRAPEALKSPAAFKVHLGFKKGFPEFPWFPEYSETSLKISVFFGKFPN